MAIKESSDEFNPTLTTAAEAVASPRAVRSARDYLALAIATCGVGYLPLAPGTWGSLLAVGVYFFAHIAFLNPHIDTPAAVTSYVFVTGELVTIFAVTVVGIWAASRTERVLKIKDPGKVVVDEVAGQSIALLAVPLSTEHLWPVWMLVAFILFRFFDIVKPYPARKFESLHGGLGIMADDVVAGVYAAIVVAIAVVISWFI
jgi:phosphatidylglycerophosphatase A